MLVDEIWDFKSINMGRELEISGEFIYESAKKTMSITGLNNQYEINIILYTGAVGIERLQKIYLCLVLQNPTDKESVPKCLVEHNHHELEKEIEKYTTEQLSKNGRSLLGVFSNYYNNYRYANYIPGKNSSELRKLFISFLKKQNGKFNFDEPCALIQFDAFKRFYINELGKLARYYFELIEHKARDINIQAITGFAGTVLAMPPSVYLLGLDHAKVVLNVMAWLSGLMIAVTGYRHINWKELLKMSAVMLVGMFAGIQICRIVKSENILLTIYGIIIVVVALKNLCIHTEKKLPDLILWIVLILAGIIHGMFVSGGALLVIYATQVLKEKEEFRATVAPVWVVLNFFLMVTQFRSGLVGTADIRLICISILPLLIATWLGKKLVCKVSQKVFLNLTYILLLISGVSLIV